VAGVRGNCHSLSFAFLRLVRKRCADGRSARAGQTSGADARFGAVDRMNERFLAVRRKQQSSAHASSLTRVSLQPSPLSYHPRTNHFLAPSRRVTLPHSQSLVSLTLVRARQRRIAPVVCRRYKGERQPPSRELRYHAVKTKRLTSVNRAARHL